MRRYCRRNPHIQRNAGRCFQDFCHCFRDGPRSFQTQRLSLTLGAILVLFFDEELAESEALFFLLTLLELSVRTYSVGRQYWELLCCVEALYVCVLGCGRSVGRFPEC